MLKGKGDDDPSLLGRVFCSPIPTEMLRYMLPRIIFPSTIL